MKGSLHDLESLPEWAHELERGRPVDALGFPILAYRSVTSTSDLLKELALEGAPEGLTVLAREQTSGRGQLGRGWVSPAREGAYLSVLLKPERQEEDTKWLSCLAELATAQALEQLGAEGVGLKYPNDVLVRGRKIAGVLVEPRIGRGQVHFAVVGIGVNVTQREEDWPDELKGKATSLVDEGVEAELDEVIRAVLNELNRLYRQTREKGCQFLQPACEERRMMPAYES